MTLFIICCGFIGIFGTLVAAVIEIRRERGSIRPSHVRSAEEPLRSGTKEITMSIEKNQSSVKRSRGILWWGGLLTVWYFYSGQLKWALRIGSGWVALFSLVGFAWLIGVCALWYFLSGRRHRRHWLPRIFGNAFFAIGSVTPMSVVAPTFGGKPPSLDILAISVVISLVFLTVAYFLLFGTRRASSVAARSITARKAPPPTPVPPNL